MGISRFNIQKWYKMFTGKSVLHVDQGVGKMFVVDDIRGYFNDLTMKVTMQEECLEKHEIPMQETERGEHIYFPVAVFQFGLGLWDFYLKTNEDKYRELFIKCADWTLENQEPNGSWNNFFFVYPDHPYGAMAQGEGASLLVRAWLLTNEKRYLDAARNAVSFMLIPVEEGGTAKYENDAVVLLEYTHLPTVLNGWLFSAIGLYDLWLATRDEQYLSVFNRTTDTLVNMLPEYDCHYWSLYDLGKHIASPFYHKLHVAQLQAFYMITRKSEFKDYGGKWQDYSRNIFFKSFATVKKALQKIKE